MTKVVITIIMPCNFLVVSCCFSNETCLKKAIILTTFKKVHTYFSIKETSVIQKALSDSTQDGHC